MSKPKYAILDNDSMTSSLLLEILNFLGKFSVEVFTSPPKLLDSLKQNKPDLIFCHITARDCDTRELLEAEVNIPCIFISALEQSEERRKCYLDSRYPYLSFPLSIENIASYI